MVATGPIPVRIIEAFRIESIQESPAHAWYPKTPMPNDTHNTAKSSRIDKAIRLTNLRKGTNFSDLRSYIIMS